MSGHEERRAASWGSDAHQQHEPYEWHEPTDRPELPEDEHEQHAGNGTVSPRPDGQGQYEATESDRFARGRGYIEDRGGSGDVGAGPGVAGGFGAGADPDDGRGPFGDDVGDDVEGDDVEGLGAGRDRLMAALAGLDRGDSPTEGAGPDESEAAPEDLGSDELALRRMLHQAVLEIEPRDGALEHLRRAVPARRARKRQALVGMAAAALFIGTAIPALVHVSDATGSDADPSMAAHASQAQGDTNQGKGPDGGSNGTVGSSDTTKGTGGKEGEKGKDDKGKGAGSGSTDGAGPTASTESAPTCTAVQLGGATGTAGAPDATGVVYGTFRVTNISTTTCTVSGAGNVSTAAQGAADASKISVVNHTTGDPATGLPAPSQEVTSLVLKPGAAYEVKFAWVPSETCPPTGGSSGGPTPDPSPSTSAPSGSTGSDSSGTSPQLMREDGVADGSVVVSHTPEIGAASSTATVTNACAGTVYRTGMLAPTP
jgi:hypothetical protein